MKFKGNFKSIISVQADEKGNLPKEIQVLPVGRWMTEPYGEMEVTTAHLDTMVKNFDDKVRGADQLPVDVDHDGGKAAGWITKLVAKAEGLFATVDWNKYGKELLTEGIYKLFSPEWSFDYIDPLNRTPHGATLIAGSLTNRPLFKQLPKLVAHEIGSEKNKDLTNENGILILLTDTMNAADILKKAKAERSVDELKFLAEAKDLTDDQKKLLADEESAEAEAKKKEEEEAKAKADADAAAAKEKADAEAEAAKTANEGKTVTMTAAEVADLRKTAEEGKKAVAELRQKATEEKVASYIANDKGGKILKKSKDAVVAFVMKCSDSQKEEFYKIIETLPEIKVAGEIGSEENSHLTAQEELNNLVTEAKKADENKDKTNSQIAKEIIAKNNELAERLAK